ncbi:MAG: hypothetical protein HKN16_09210 [Saprospiraceae bacterium]|nr:hypothetical protein [Saprospiraceae bacterium]
MRKVLILALIFGFFSCASDSPEDLVSLDLLKYGVPITIMAPDSAEVKTMDLVVQKDVSIRKGDDFYVQLFMSEASSTQSSVIAARLKGEIKSNPYFSKMISEEESGFIFENAIDSLKPSYDFRFVKVQGDKEYEFRTGLIGTFSLDEVEQMYKAIKN